MKVFLGGTCSTSTWRDTLIPKLRIDYFDPRVALWSEDAYQEEIKEKSSSNYFLYVITPQMEGFYSIAEIVDESHKYPNQTIYCFLKEDNGTAFSEKQIHSLQAQQKLSTTLNPLVVDVQPVGKYMTQMHASFQFCAIWFRGFQFFQRIYAF